MPDSFFEEKPHPRSSRCVRQWRGERKITARRVASGLRLAQAHFLTSVLISPSLFTKRSGRRAQPLFPRVRSGELSITWIGHASFLIQMEAMNVLIDPNWSMWLKVIKRFEAAPVFKLIICLRSILSSSRTRISTISIGELCVELQPISQIVVPVGVGKPGSRSRF
mgnify:CR=1 FL=1